MANHPNHLDASQVLAAALEQIDDMIAGTKEEVDNIVNGISPNGLCKICDHNQTCSVALLMDKLKLAIERESADNNDNNTMDPIDLRTASFVSQWLEQWVHCNKVVIKMECQVDKKEHCRHFLLFAFDRGAKATEAAREMCEVYGEEAMPLRTAQNWFKRFKDSNFDLNNDVELKALRGVSFNNDVELKAWLDDFFESKSGDFYRRGIEQLVERWEEVVNNNRQYIID